MRLRSVQQDARKQKSVEPPEVHSELNALRWLPLGAGGE